MNRNHEKSLKLYLNKFKGKKAKVLYDLIRSAIKQEHGYRATKGLTDICFGKWPIVIRFITSSNRTEFINSLEGLLSKKVLSKISPTKLKPLGKTTSAVRFAKYS